MPIRKIENKTIYSLLCLSFLSVNTGFAMISEQAKDYHQALKLISQEKYKQYYPIKAKLEKTPLYSYLQYQEIKQSPQRFKQTTIDSYIHDNNDTYWAYQLKRDLVRYYVQKEDWNNMLHYYSSNLNLGVNGKCNYLNALYLVDGQKGQQQALTQFTDLWLSRINLPRTCDAIEKVWLKNYQLSERQIRTRAYSLATSGKLKEALKWIDKVDNKELKGFYILWQKAILNPKKYLDDWVVGYSKVNGFSAAITLVMNDLSRQDTHYAARLWESFKQKSRLDDKTIHLITAEIAIDFARAHNKQAIKWLSRIDNQHASSLLWQWRLRTALYWNDYSLYLNYYKQLPETLKSQEGWKYWEAVAYQKTDNAKKTTAIFKTLADSRSYYGFLSADAVKQTYVINQQDPQVSEKAINAASQNKMVQSAFDLYQLGLYRSAYGFWRWSIKQLTPSQMIAASTLANQKQMYQFAVNGFANAGAMNNIKGRFPLAFWSDIQKAAKRFDINPALIVAMMRQESMFQVEGQSFAGASGLMQLMPATAKFLAQKYKLPYQSQDDLFQPSYVIMLGAANLNFMDHLFSDNQVLGIAAYNAGQGNVANWLPKHEIAGAQWIETMPFGETRDYVKNILAYLTIYEFSVLKDQKFRLSQVINSVSAKDKS